MERMITLSCATHVGRLSLQIRQRRWHHDRLSQRSPRRRRDPARAGGVVRAGESARLRNAIQRVLMLNLPIFDDAGLAQIDLDRKSVV